MTMDFRWLGAAPGTGLAVYGRIVDLGPDSVRLEASVFDVIGDRILADVEVEARADRMAPSGTGPRGATIRPRSAFS